MRRVCKVISTTILGVRALRVDSREDEDGEDDSYDYPSGGTPYLVRQQPEPQALARDPPDERLSNQWPPSLIVGESRDTRKPSYGPAGIDPRLWSRLQYPTSSTMQDNPYNMQSMPMAYPSFDSQSAERGIYASSAGVVADMQPKSLSPQAESMASASPTAQHASFVDFGKTNVVAGGRGAPSASVGSSSDVAQNKQPSVANSADPPAPKPPPPVSLVDKTSSDYSANYADYPAVKETKTSTNATAPAAAKLAAAPPASLRQVSASTAPSTAKQAVKGNKTSSQKIKARHCRQPENFEGWAEYCKWSKDLHIYGTSVFMMNFEKCTMGWAAGPDADAKSRKDALCREDGSGFCRPYDADGKKCSDSKSLVALNSSATDGSSKAASNASSPARNAANSKASPASLVEATPKAPANMAAHETASQNGATNPSKLSESTPLPVAKALSPDTQWQLSQLADVSRQPSDLDAREPQRWPVAPYAEQAGVFGQQFRPLDSSQMSEGAPLQGLHVPLHQMQQGFPSQQSLSQGRVIPRPLAQELPDEPPQLSETFQQMGAQQLRFPAHGPPATPLARGIPATGAKGSPRLLKESLMEPSDTLVKLSGSVCPKQEELLDGRDCYLRHDDQCQYVLEECPDGSAKTFTTLQCHGRRWVSRAHTMICTAADQSRDQRNLQRVSLQQAGSATSMRGNSRRCPEKEPTGLDDCDRPLNCQYVRGKCADGADNFVTWKCIAQQWMSTAVGCD